MRIGLRFLGLLAIAGLATGCAAQAASLALTGTFDRTLTISGPVELLVTTGSGRIQVHRGSDTQVRVVGYIRASDGWLGGVSTADVKALEANPPIVRRDNSIEVGRLPPSIQNVSISYDITVPARTRLDSRTGSGSLDIESILGPVEAHTGSGGIHIDKIDSMVLASTGSGSIEVLGARGGDFHTGSGSIDVSGISDAMRARTGSGHITAEGTMTKDWMIQTGSGGVTVHLPSNAAFDLDARSNSRVSVTHPVESSASFDRRRVQGRIRGGGPRLSVTTGSGSIRVD